LRSIYLVQTAAQQEINMPFWTSGSGVIELEMTMEQARSCTHPGPCDVDVLRLSADPGMARQLAAIKADVLRQVLSEYGAWSAEDLADHHANLQRILWIAAGDIFDGNQA
jgi:hypothetical protein